jgi:hypothetical protein
MLIIHRLFGPAQQLNRAGLVRLVEKPADFGLFNSVL